MVLPPKNKKGFILGWVKEIYVSNKLSLKKLPLNIHLSCFTELQNRACMYPVVQVYNRYSLYLKWRNCGQVIFGSLLFPPAIK